MVARLLPVLVGAPIVIACAVAVLGRLVPRAVADVTTTTGAAATTGLAAWMLVATGARRSVDWVAGWHPHGGVGVGIPLVGDPLSLAMAILIGALVTCATLYGWRYIASDKGHLHALMLLFLAGMNGFCLSGDLFNMFVFFELMGVVAYALTAFEIEDETAVHGGLSFAIVNSFGAYLSLAGIALIYARAGQLGLPQLHLALTGRSPDALVVASFVLICTGLLVKAALVPFHFWLADAHAVAPPPVCVLFSGIMVELGLYGVARIYWVAYSGTIPQPVVRNAFVALGALTAIVGAVMCLAQRHLKRMLAYSTIAHMGLFTMAFATLSSSGTAGAVLYAAGHAGVKSALFLIAGVLLNRYRTVDEHALFGAARRERVMPILWFAAALGLAGLPPFGTALGKAICEEALSVAGDGFGPALFVLVSAATGGAVLRAGLRVYRGWGERPTEKVSAEETSGDQEEPDTQRLSRTPATMLAPIVLLVLGGLAVGCVPGIRRLADLAARQLVDAPGYVAAAMRGAGPAVVSPDPAVAWTGTGVTLGLASTVLAVLIACGGLWSPRLLRLLGRTAVPGSALMTILRRAHSGRVGDYIAWLFLGVAALAALIGLPLR